MNLIRLLLLVALVPALGASIRAQSKDEKLRTEVLEASNRFRTHAGLVNFVAGDVRCSCGGMGGARSESESRLIDGDTIQTGDGRAEVLLNPGYHLRLDRNTEMLFMDLSAANLKVKLLKGSAIVEIAMDNDVYPRELRELVFDTVTMITPTDEYAVIRAGAYRFEVNNAGSRVTVFKGGVVVAGMKLKDGHTSTLVGGNRQVTTEEKPRADAFDVWSRERAAKLVQSNQSLKKTQWYKLMRNDKAYLDLSGKSKAADLNKGTVSALTGVVTYVEKASIKKESEDWQELASDTRLTNGDNVRTAEDSRVEIGPYPYFFVFLRGNTEIIYAETTEGNVSIKLVKGSIIAIVNAPNKMTERNVLKLVAGKAEYEIQRSGYYRLDSLASDRTAMLIYEGKLVFDGREIGDAKQILSGGDHILQSSFDKKAKDSFNIWAEHRMMRDVIARRRNTWYAGAWFLDPETNEYTFVPGDRHCKSPYGGNYSVMYKVNHDDATTVSSTNTHQPGRPVAMMSDKLQFVAAYPKS